mmetsp:Transcript_16694/g.27875  ORF Transcript_16694/g.27875 Transcript_16694/m.27875 type:complete len:229 (+) Transcript_16694:2020-2706(+)
MPWRAKSTWSSSLQPCVRLMKLSIELTTSRNTSMARGKLVTSSLKLSTRFFNLMAALRRRSDLTRGSSCENTVTRDSHSRLLARRVLARRRRAYITAAASSSLMPAEDRNCGSCLTLRASTVGELTPAAENTAISNCAAEGDRSAKPISQDLIANCSEAAWSTLMSFTTAWVESASTSPSLFAVGVDSHLLVDVDWSCWLAEMMDRIGMRVRQDILAEDCARTADVSV